MPSADDLLGREVAEALARSIRDAAPGLEVRSLSAAAGGLGDLSLRERADCLRDALLADVPGDYQALAQVVRAAGRVSGEFTGWLIWPVTGAVASRAVQEGTAEAFDDAMDVLAELTHRLTAEFSVRPLLRHDLGRGLEIVRGWTQSEDEHVRRLASEGTRPYLPWAVRVPALTANPGVTIPVLDALYRDESEYVRRSVANHLNDLSRDVPDLVVRTARGWLAAPAETTPWVVRHGLRTLIKKGHRGALELLGFGGASVEVDGPVVSPVAVPWGGSVTFTAELRNTGAEPARLAIDYVVYHRRANGAQSPKTFKLTTRTLGAGESVTVERRHSFRAITTRRYYPGPHALALQVNGIATEPVPFELLAPPASPDVALERLT
ncbi:DNA alkylation repair protein [Sediminivirga luteola]|uniref:3-methyladenine DNA glycosylase AlkC n=1 Tax=Sediminivirga luteola TaxID=1774748 RepID=A0A8J2TWC6_9MICO|nr:DNA alkylation repair protein [Sediminivirga luteola]MCI2266569.1 DNA alkylation repair protein [Sediminivirga luteola]GGA07962.1 hypothetical protein GCM10011333_08460 [Sediminivirga luteola]